MRPWYVAAVLSWFWSHMPSTRVLTTPFLRKCAAAKGQPSSSTPINSDPGGSLPSLERSWIANFLWSILGDDGFTGSDSSTLETYGSQMECRTPSSSTAFLRQRIVTYRVLLTSPTSGLSSTPNSGPSSPI